MPIAARARVNSAHSFSFCLMNRFRRRWPWTIPAVAQPRTEAAAT